ncbi:MAG TPA: hypothetical protein VM846_01125 [Vicinamibacterales bacterium]|jgi:hypothetical protein|nr:hypothetical protein [Vicinamibacterales bacterium]
MRLSRILLLIGALALPAIPAAAQGKAIGKPAGVGKPITTAAKGPKTTTGAATKGQSANAKAGTLSKGKSADAKSGTLAKGNSADHAKGPKTAAADTDATTGTDVDTDTTATTASKGRGQLPLNEKIALNPTLKARLDALLVGGTMTFDEATTGWRNQGQLVAAMNAAKNNNLSFASIYTEMVTNGKKLPDAVTAVKALTPPPAPTTTETTTTTTTTTPTTPTTP